MNNRDNEIKIKKQRLNMRLKQIFLIFLFLLSCPICVQGEQQLVTEGDSFGVNYGRLNHNDTELYARSLARGKAWNILEQYDSGDVVTSGSSLYISLQNSNVGNVVTSGVWWTEMAGGGGPDWTLASPEYYGAVCDGTTNDTIAVNLAIASGNSLLFKNLCSVDALTFDQSNVTYQGIEGGGLILHTANSRLATVSGNTVEFSGMVFSGASLDVDSALVVANEGVTGLHINKCVFKDMLGTGTSIQAALQLQSGASDAIVEDCLFDNLQATNATATPQTAYIAGVQIWLTSSASNNFIIRDNTFNNIYSNNTGGDINLSSADGIRVYSDTLRNLKLVIQNNTFRSVQKSAIKLQGVSGVTVEGTTVYGDLLEMPMFAAIRLHNNSSGCHISDTTVNGNVSRGIHIDGDNVTIDGLRYYPSGWDNDFQMVFVSGVDVGTVSAANITVRNLDGTNINQVLTTNYSMPGNQFQFCTDLVVENVSVAVRDTATTNTEQLFHIRNADRVTFRNIEVKNEGDTIDDCFVFVNTDNIIIENVRASAKGTIVSFEDTSTTVTGNNVRIANCDFYRTLSGTDENSVFMRFVDVEDINISNTVFSAPSYSTLLNNQSLRIAANNITLANLKFVTRSEGSGNATDSVIVLTDAEDFNVSNIFYDVQDSAIQLSTNAIELKGSCTNGLISNVISNSKGIEVENTAVNVQVENIKSADTAQLSLAAGADVHSIRYTATDIEGYVNGAWVSLTSGSDELTSDELAAVNGAATPSATNVFATMDDVGGSGGDFSSPPPIGDIAPNTGGFTYLQCDSLDVNPPPSGSTGEMAIHEDVDSTGNDVVGWKSPVDINVGGEQLGDLLWVLPGDDGTDGQVMATNGLQSMGWITPQLRVNDGCTEGSSIRAIAVDGSVVCETDDNAGGDLLSSNNLSDLDNVVTARGNLLLGSAATLDSGTDPGDVLLLTGVCTGGVGATQTECETDGGTWVGTIDGFIDDTAGDGDTNKILSANEMYQRYEMVICTYQSSDPSSADMQALGVNQCIINTDSATKFVRTPTGYFTISGLHSLF